MHEAARETSKYDRIQSILINLYVFVDRRGVAGLRNDIIDLLAEQRGSGWPLLSGSTERVGIAFSCLPSNSTLCRYLIDEATFCWDGKLAMIEHLQDLPTEFTVEAMKATLKYTKKPDDVYMPDWRSRICMLHDHADDVEKTRCAAAHAVWFDKMIKMQRMEPVKV